MEKLADVAKDLEMYNYSKTKVGQRSMSTNLGGTPFNASNLYD